MSKENLNVSWLNVGFAVLIFAVGTVLLLTGRLPDFVPLDAYQTEGRVFALGFVFICAAGVLLWREFRKFFLIG